MAILTQAITNSSSTDTLTLPGVLGGADIAPSGTKTDKVDSDNISEAYLQALQDLKNKGDATTTFVPTEVEEGDVLADFNKAVQQGLSQTRSGVQAVGGTATQAVVFAVDMPDDQYVVSMLPDAAVGAGVAAFVTLKLVTGFTINFEAAFTGNVEWLVTAL